MICDQCKEDTIVRYLDGEWICWHCYIMLCLTIWSQLEKSNEEKQILKEEENESNI